MLEKTPDFPSDFHWGVAMSAAQVEGMPLHDGAGPSIWHEFSKKSRRIKNRHSPNHACNFYTHYKSDIGIIKQLGIPNFRFSTAWPRILPQGVGAINHKGLDFYKRITDECLEQNIEPWLTLYHWDLPQALENKGGWTNREMLDWFGEYVYTCAKHLGDRVNHWIVLNEPMAFTGAGYFLGLHAPGKLGMRNFIPAMHHAALCQSLGGNILRAELPSASIGTSFSMSSIHPASQNPKDLMAAERVHALLNRLFLEPTLGLGYPSKELPFLKKVEKYMRDGDENQLIFDFDFIGIQNYTREVVAAHKWIPYMGAKVISAKKRKVKTTAMGWEIYPDALTEVLDFTASYPMVKKIFITENGAAFEEPQPFDGQDDTHRMDYLKENINAVLQAQSLSDKIKGYFVWSLLDNFEWAEGYNPRFGIVHVDFESEKRSIKRSAYWYKDFIAKQL